MCYNNSLNNKYIINTKLLFNFVHILVKSAHFPYDSLDLKTSKPAVKCANNYTTKNCQIKQNDYVN